MSKGHLGLLKNLHFREFTLFIIATGKYMNAYEQVCVKYQLKLVVSLWVVYLLTNLCCFCYHKFQEFWEM